MRGLISAENPSGDTINFDKLCSSMGFTNSLIKVLGGKVTQAVKSQQSCGEMEVDQVDLSASSPHMGFESLSNNDEQSTPFASNYSQISGCCEHQLDRNIDFITKRIRKTKKITDCPHKNATFYSKGMCRNCYHARGRKKPATMCEHTNKPNYALGLCKNCYLRGYHKARRTSGPSQAQ